MRKLFRFRFLLMLAVLGCLLSLLASGCSEDDRAENNSPVPAVSPSPEVSPEPSPSLSPAPSPAPSLSPSPSPSPSPEASGVISYLFLMQDGAARKVSSAAAEAELTAYAADGSILEGVELLESSIASMTREGEYYAAEAAVPAEAVMLAYTFRHGSEIDGVYAIALNDGVERYYMAYSDLVGEPSLAVYADAEHKTPRKVFAPGESLYPSVSVKNKGGLAVPVTAVVPVNTDVVAYSAADDPAAASYEAAEPGQTAFSVTVAAAELETSSSVTVTEKTPAWILPPQYELKDGKIYKGEEQIGDPSEIEAKLPLSSGGEVQCQLIAAAGGDGSDVSYEPFEADVTVEITSDTAAHFSAAAEGGILTVAAASEAESGESAAVACAAAGVEFQNRADVSVVGLRQIAIYVPTMSYDAPEDPEADNLIRIAAIGAGDQALEGAQLAEENISGLTTENLGTDDDPYWLLEAVVPANAETVLLLSSYQWTGSSGEVFCDLVPYFAFKLAADEDRYVMTENEFFVPYYDYGIYGTYEDAAFTERSNQFFVGEQVYFWPEITNNSGLTVKVSDIKSEDTSVIDENLKAVGSGSVWLTGSWYGVEGYVYPDSEGSGITVSSNALAR